MTLAMQIALTATPLAAYFYVLAIFHSGRKPRLVAGPVDVGLLAIGLGGLVIFGPFGRAVLGRVVGDHAGPFAWAVWAGLVTLWAFVLAGSATLRLTVYHISPEELVGAVREALGRLDGHFVPTLRGFEDAAQGTGVTVKPIRWFHSGSVEAYGRTPDALIRALRGSLVEALDRIPQKPSSVTHCLYLAACLTMILPVSGFFATDPKAQEALRALMQSIRWW